MINVDHFSFFVLIDWLVGWSVGWLAASGWLGG